MAARRTVKSFGHSRVSLGGSVATWGRLGAVLGLFGAFGSMLEASCNHLEDHGARNEVESIRVPASRTHKKNQQFLYTCCFPGGGNLGVATARVCPVQTPGQG